MILEVIADSCADSIRLLPVLFFTYLVMVYLEPRAGARKQDDIRKSGKAGPAIGGLLGVFPQCGFSAAASNLYAGRIISLGTLMAVFLSTSDEMLPIMISENVGLPIMGKILAVKVFFAVFAGFGIDLVYRRKDKDMQIEHLCERHHCHCERGIWKSALHHTLEVFIYILLISFVLNLVIALIGEETLGALILHQPVAGVLIAALVGMIPNCAASVIVTKLYLGGVLGAGALIAGLLSGTGVGYLVLLKVNDDRRENLRILFLLYGIGVMAGVIVEFMNMVF